MTASRLFSTAILVGLLNSFAFGQATTVQLPTFSYFTVNTSVLVPDGGSAFAGGVNRASSGINERGLPGLSSLNGPLFGSRGISSVQSGSGVRVSATIHDFEAIDDALLNSIVSGRPLSSPAQQLAADKGPAAAGRGVQSVADIQRQQASEQVAMDDEVRKYIEQGDAAVASGKPGVAKIYYQMAARRATGTVLADVQTKLRSLSTPAVQVASQPGR